MPGGKAACGRGNEAMALRSGGDKDSPLRSRQTFYGKAGIVRLEEVRKGVEGHPLGGALLPHIGKTGVDKSNFGKTAALQPAFQG